jgi:uncharacterized membrane protein
VVHESVKDLAQLAERERRATGQADRIADRISSVAGSMPFAVFNAVFFAGWILANSGIGGLPAVDPYPFGGLTVIVSLEAIFLAVFVLMSQNRQAAASDRRASVDMHMDAIAEREVTKVLEVLQELRNELGVQRKEDRELRDMLRRTDIEELVEAVEEVEQRVEESHPRRQDDGQDKGEQSG